MLDLQHALSWALTLYTVGHDLSPTTMLIRNPPSKEIMRSLEQQYVELMSSEANTYHSFMEQLQSCPNDVRDTLFEESGLMVLSHLLGKIPASTPIEPYNIEPALADHEICKAIQTGYYTNPKSLLRKLMSQQSHSLQRAFEIKDGSGKKLASMLHARTCRKRCKQQNPGFYVSTVQEIIKNIAQYASREQLQSQLDNLKTTAYRRNKNAQAIKNTLKEIIKQRDNNNNNET